MPIFVIFLPDVIESRQPFAGLLNLKERLPFLGIALGITGLPAQPLVGGALFRPALGFASEKLMNLLASPTASAVFYVKFLFVAASAWPRDNRIVDPGIFSLYLFNHVAPMSHIYWKHEVE